MRIVHAAHFQLRKYGKAQVSTEAKLLNGLIRLNHNVQLFSERDVSAFEAPFGWRDLGRRKTNLRFLETCENFRPDLVILNHCDIITNKSLLTLREAQPQLRMAYCNVDALYQPRNVARIEARAPVVDHLFLTTSGVRAKSLAPDPKKVSYLPNMVDAAIERANNSTKSSTLLDRDLVFCGRGDPSLPRFALVRELREKLGALLRFDTFGFDGTPPVWGNDYDQILAGSKMGLSLNREEGSELCSSARVAQLAGNGILTFIHQATGLQRFFDQRAVFFDNLDDLHEKIRHYHSHDEERRNIAAAGYDYVHREMSSRRVAQFIVDRTLDLPATDYPWSDC